MLINRKIFVGALVLSFLAGYLMAVFLFTKTIWVGASSGREKQVCSIFPFRLTEYNSRRAFEVMFLPSFSDNEPKEDWLIVTTMAIAPMLVKDCGTTVGSFLFRAQNRLADRMVMYQIPREEKRQVYSVFRNMVDMRDYGGALLYSMTVRVDSATGTISKPEASNADIPSLQSDPLAADIDVQSRGSSGIP